MAPSRNMRVQVLKPDYSGVIGSIPDYLSCSVTWQYLGVGTGTLSVRESGDPALQLMQARDLVVPVTVKAPGYPRWSGRVVHFEATRSTGQAGRIVATLTDETQWLKSILAAPTPGSGWGAQTTEYDTRTGPLETVAKAFVAANLARLAAEGRNPPLVVVPTRGLGPTVTGTELQARNVPLQSLLIDALRAAGMNMTATLWLPGDPAITGLTLTTATVVVDVTVGRDRPYVNFRDTAGGLTGRKVAGSHPQAVGVLVMGPGEGTAREFHKVMATDGRVAALGKWGFPEATLEATDVDPGDTAAFTKRGLERLAELSGTASVAPEIDDRRPWSASPSGDYWVGDVARATFSGVTIQDRIDRFTVTDNRDGFTAAPQFGASRDTESADVQLARTVAEIRREQQRDQARK